jgi:membrane-bound lytic murein transglycosylase A
VKPGPDFAQLSVPRISAARALAAFRISCPTLLRRKDASLLTDPGDWSAACSAAAGWPDDNALQFFSGYFETAVVGDGKAFATGYYEPRIAASRTKIPGYEVPIYRVPGDLIDLDLGMFSPDLAGRHVRGRALNGQLVPYYDRGEIEDGVLVARSLEIAWAADPIDLFFLQIQGSGELIFPDGSTMRIGYAGQNGRDYVAIGGLLRQRGLIGGPISMQAIRDWLRANPDQGRALMREDKSYVFFKELTGPGPLGALGRPLTPRASAAADPRFVPLGAPVVLVSDRPEPKGLWIAQDTGGAIKGANRIDTFWGGGDEAAAIAGGMSAHGQAWLLLPKGVLARKGSHAPPGQ